MSVRACVRVRLQRSLDELLAFAFDEEAKRCRRGKGKGCRVKG